MSEFTPDDYVYPECGCQISSAVHKIAYCPKHSAVDALYEALSFAKSVIKSGEPWTDTCEDRIQGALALASRGRRGNLKVAV